MAFTAGPVPTAKNSQDQETLNLIWELFQQIEIETQYFALDEINIAPTGPVEGMVLFADGTNWDPGSGRGLYRYSGTAWEAL